MTLLYLNCSTCFTGNELSGNGVGARVGADQYAADVINLKTIVDTAYQGFQTKPLVLAPGGFFDARWFTELVSKTKPSSLDVLTHHIYNLGAGILQTQKNVNLVSVMVNISLQSILYLPYKLKVSKRL